eukprot:Blabericola_migrator_1__7611@NODE_388_length_9090_cov_142_959769_g311_i0_p8_GENE_NODE_388_length_9090_cov_142_959769_g311_i0NODE_388_length_9090_cov_142_959769_g311_i0_p8_ORF_typecomplete_len102_score13_94Gate/PF07670_14/0_16_NODE_388_length_9090_cov_142_959769_g311_i0503808
MAKAIALLAEVNLQMDWQMTVRLSLSWIFARSCLCTAASGSAYLPEKRHKLQQAETTLTRELTAMLIHPSTEYLNPAELSVVASAAWDKIDNLKFNFNNDV